MRVFQEFATLDLISNGRAELVVGRGSFGEAFPLFGYARANYDALFAEKLDMLLAIRAHEHVRWAGRASTRGRCRRGCPCGWGWAARRPRSCEPARWASH